MKDFDRIKEKSKKDEFKGILGLGLIFLIAVGVIVYILINLTNQYFNLKSQLEESKEEKRITMTVPDEGKTYEYTISNDNKKIRKVTSEEKKENKVKEKNTEKNESNEMIAEAKITKKPKNDNTSEKEESKAEIGNTKVKQKKVVENKKDMKKSVETEKKELKSVGQTHVKSNKEHETKAKVNFKYTVQLMAFQNKDDAEKQLNKLKKQVDDIYIMKADLGKKGVWYRVRCCKSQTKQEALKKSKTIDKKLNIKSIVVRY